jgi:hypothetical protein
VSSYSRAPTIPNLPSSFDDANMNHSAARAMPNMMQMNMAPPQAQMKVQMARERRAPVRGGYGASASLAEEGAGGGRDEDDEEQGVYATAGFLAAGSLPVRLEIEGSGVEYRFEQRIVVSEQRTIEVEYKRDENRGRKKRKLGFSPMDMITSPFDYIKINPKTVLITTLAYVAYRFRDRLF